MAVEGAVFQGRWSLVTGASSGIGRELARGIAARGGHVALVARSEEALQELGRQLADEHGVQTRVFRADLAEPGAGRALFERVGRSGLPPLEHLINNAGVGHAAPLSEAEWAPLLRMLRLNCEALVELSHAFLPAMLERGSGGLMNLSSVQGFVPVPYMAVYCATKAFVRSFTESLAEEVRGSGVRVCVVCPGHVPSGFQAAAGFETGAVHPPGGLSARETAERALDGYVRGRRIVVTGALNHATTLVARGLPSSVVTGVGARMMRKLGRFA